MFIFAYLDPGSGSLMLQILVGGFAGLAAFARYRWGSVKAWFRRGRSSEE